jgi:hypothetical protein
MVTVPMSREAPATSPLELSVADPSHPNASHEPRLHVDNIQGNILSGFNKDHQMLLVLEINDPDAFKQWLASQIPFIATAASATSASASAAARRPAPSSRWPSACSARWG